MGDDKMVIPYIVYEGEQTRNERNIKRLIIALVVSIVVLFASNAMWLVVWMQYDYSGEELVTVDGREGIANYIGNDGSIFNGENSGD